MLDRNTNKKLANSSDQTRDASNQETDQTHSSKSDRKRSPSYHEMFIKRNSPAFRDSSYSPTASNDGLYSHENNSYLDTHDSVHYLSDRNSVHYLSDRREVDQWIHQNDIKWAFFQASYMTGDRYGVAIATAMVNKNKFGILILTDTNERNMNDAEELANFYNILLKKVGKDKQNRIAIFTAKDNSIRSEYDYYRNMHIKRGDTTFKRPPFATKIVADLFQLSNKRSKGGRQNMKFSNYLAKELLGEVRRENGMREVPEAKIIEEYIQKYLPDKGKYAFIWSRTWNATRVHPEHTSTCHGLKQIIQAAQDAGRRPVLIGDRHLDWKNHTDNPGGNAIELWDFWNHQDFPQELKQKGRVGQLLLFRHLHTSSERDVVHIGMRSGTLEGIALFGMPTIYMEEKRSDTALNLEQLLPHVKQFHRLILDHPVGIDQQRGQVQYIEGNVKMIDSDEEQSIEIFERALKNMPALRNFEISLDDAKNVFFTVKEEYSKYLKRKLEGIKSSYREGFSQSDLKNMKAILGMKDKQIEGGEAIDHWKFKAVNASCAFKFCKKKIKQILNILQDKSREVPTQDRQDDRMREYHNEQPSESYSAHDRKRRKMD